MMKSWNLVSETFHRILVIEGLGFFLVLVLIWVDEVLDLPHAVLGAPATPVNIHESVFETMLIGALALITLGLTRHLLSHIHVLEGFLSICCQCKKVRVGEECIPLENYIREHSEAELSHGLCPVCKDACLEKMKQELPLHP